VRTAIQNIDSEYIERTLLLGKSNRAGTSCSRFRIPLRHGPIHRCAHLDPFFTTSLPVGGSASPRSWALFAGTEAR